ncbi:hypothetical protein NL676_007311 [Syzygium grande]|nr:hypothetical protein NL676_007311 [Syzygium grande]
MRGSSTWTAHYEDARGGVLLACGMARPPSIMAMGAGVGTESNRVGRKSSKGLAVGALSTVLELVIMANARELARIGDGAEACLYKAGLRLDKQLGSWIVVDESRGAVVSHD